jgi:hypothetical protein
MLTAPAYSEIEGVTIFTDDTLFYKFYPVAKAPSIRLDEQGRPIFLLVKYAFSDEDRLANKNLPAGGGYCSFDVDFDVSAATLEKVRAALQPTVNELWQRYKAGPAADQARPGVAGTAQPPAVEFGTPTFTSGKVSLDAPQAKELVSARVAEGEPSLLAGNIAAFSLDLTPAGATFMQRTLVDPAGPGNAIDLTPIQVAYDLKFWARLPAVRIKVKADSQRVYQYVRKVMDGRGMDACTTYDFQHTDITNDSLSVTGAVDVQIDTGSGSLPDNVLEELRQYSLDLVKQMIQATFFTNTPAAPAGGSDADIPTGDTGKKYLKQNYDAATMSIEFNLEQRSVVEWPIHPQATLETFFRGLPPEEVKQHVRSIDLHDDFFANLTLNVRAFTDYSSPEVAAVEVQVHYEGTDENGQSREKNQSFTFSSTQAQAWAPSLIGSQREYQYRYRVGFKGKDPVAFSPWVASKATDLNIWIPDPGRLKLDVLAGDIDFDTLVRQVQVRLAYEDPDAAVSREEYVVTLNPTQPASQYLRTIYQPKAKPIQYKIRFAMKSGEVREDAGWQTTNGPQLLVNQPYVDLLRVSLLPTGDGWDDVVAVQVDLKYEDLANNYRQQDTLAFRTREEFKTWRVSLRNRNVQDFQYAVNASLKNGNLLKSGWLGGTGSGTYPVSVMRQGIRVLLLPDILDFTTASTTEVTLRYKAAGRDLSETFTFHDKTAQAWSVNVPQGSPVEYTYQVTHYPPAGNPVLLPEATERDDVLVLPPYRPPKAGQLNVQVLATLVDLTKTPIVTVDLNYDDDLNNVHEVGALTFTDSKTQTWSIASKDASLKTFRYKLTYFTADGADHPQPVKASDIPRIILPKWQP